MSIVEKEKKSSILKKDTKYSSVDLGTSLQGQETFLDQDDGGLSYSVRSTRTRDNNDGISFASSAEQEEEVVTTDGRVSQVSFSSDNYGESFLGTTTTTPNEETALIGTPAADKTMQQEEDQVDDLDDEDDYDAPYLIRRAAILQAPTVNIVFFLLFASMIAAKIYLQSPTLVISILFTLAIILGMSLLVAMYEEYVYSQYLEEFKQKRFCRSHHRSPSTWSQDRPDVRNRESFFAHVMDLEDLMFKKPTNRQVDLNRMSLKEKIEYLNKPSADSLDMDHVYLNFFQVLWAFASVGTFSYILWRKATYILKLRILLVEKWGWTWFKRRTSSLEEVVAKLVLEQTQVIHYVGQKTRTFVDSRRNKEVTTKIASFYFPNFPILEADGKSKITKYLSVEIDLLTKKMVSATLEDENLTVSEALILLWFNTISAQHVKVHSYGNWGVNPTAEMKEINPFYEQCSVVSVIYNFFGFTAFNRYIDTWKNEGLLSKDWDAPSLIDTFAHGIKENVSEHSLVSELVPHSHLVRFIVGMRKHFHKEFRKHVEYFPGVNVEGLFAATILHSLDHQLMEWNLDDALWLDVSHPRFGKMAELGRIVRVGFVPQVPGYYFHRFFKGSGEPFFENLYKKAEKINKRLADSMETCICR